MVKLYDIIKTMRKRISKNLIPHRNRILYDVWEQNKNQLSMEDLATILHRDLGTFYQIIKHQKVKNIISK